MKSAACMTIKKPGAMTEKERKKIVVWLRKQATNLLKHGKQYNDTASFRATYHYADDAK